MMNLRSFFEKVLYDCNNQHIRHENYGSNNHDHQKRSYTSCDDAEDVIERMRNQGKDPNRTLRAYYNRHCERWFVGNGRYSTNN
mmetsp:Transcript_30905/g.70661  ORF Transcript_30905/g.70661 Transcript_30905/m.70661 type:complete len:84 (+) Transcript_30905:216-467(+)